MPPNGLYQMSRHHLYGNAIAPRRRYSSLSFQESEPTAPATVIEEAAHVVNNLSDRQMDADVKKSKHKKKGTEAVTTKDEVKAEKSRLNTGEDAKVKSKKRRKTDDVVSTPTKKQKKVKQVKSPKDKTVAEKQALNGVGSFVANSDTWLQELKSSMGDVAAAFGTPATPVRQTSPKKLKKSKSWHTGNDRQTPDAVPNHGKKSRVNAPQSQHPRTKQNMPTENESKDLDSVQAEGTPVKITPKQTPILVPSQPIMIRTTHRDSLGRHQGRPSDVLVTETPPSKTRLFSRGHIRTPIDLGNAKLSGARTTRLRHSKAPTILLSSPSTLDDDVRNEVTRQSRASDPASLTASNLQRYTQPLNDTPQPRLHSRAASVAPSSTGSSTATTSSMNIREAFTRARRTSVSSPTRDDLLSSQSTPKHRRHRKDTHEEANIDTFDACFHTSQVTVNFTDEATYLSLHLQWRSQYAASGPPPCLNVATGCSSKGEQLLRLSQSDPSKLLSALSSTSEADQNAFDKAVHDAKEAKQFLANAIAAHVPVPLGVIDGVYTLYCPSYSAHHIDKYGFGQRTLSISRPTGFRHNTTYTARMSIPPRSMAYTFLAFDVPPHASFRSTTLTTSAEGYELEIVFLGNGYLQLRMDLGELLKGKKNGIVGGKGVMEFLGVREKDGKSGVGAVEWVRMEGGKEDLKDSKSGGERLVEKPKKKRGRPPKVREQVQ